MWLLIFMQERCCPLLTTVPTTVQQHVEKFVGLVFLCLLTFMHEGCTFANYRSKSIGEVTRRWGIWRRCRAVLLLPPLYDIFRQVAKDSGWAACPKSIILLATSFLSVCKRCLWLFLFMDDTIHFLFTNNNAVKEQAQRDPILHTVSICDGWNSAAPPPT